MLFGKRLIAYIRARQIKETVRELGLQDQGQKQGTPTMGGIIILASILVPVLLFGDLTNVYVLLMIVTTIWLGFVGFVDDYIKVFKRNKKGLAGRMKILGQVLLGLFVGTTLYLSEEVVVREINEIKVTEHVIDAGSKNEKTLVRKDYQSKDVKSTVTTIPFFKDNEGDYAKLIGFMGKENAQRFSWIIYILFTIVIITAVSNGANLTDGMDGLATGTSAIIGTTLGIFAYVSGNMIFADYLNIMYIPHTGELVIYMSAFIGATIGFLWYNSYPAQVFMGDTGSLALGGIIAVFAIIIRKELLIPILCGIFLVESVSVMGQVAWFKYTKKRYGEGKRIFRMAPLHHHYQVKGFSEPKIVMRFMIVGIMLAVITVVTLKIR
jgi:phospho-N-acetylmuramoyl-pentapeptide-transferase